MQQTPQATTNCNKNAKKTINKQSNYHKKKPTSTNRKQTSIQTNYFHNLVFLHSVGSQNKQKWHTFNIRISVLKRGVSTPATRQRERSQRGKVDLTAEQRSHLPTSSWADLSPSSSDIVTFSSPNLIHCWSHPSFSNILFQNQIHFCSPPIAALYRCVLFTMQDFVQEYATARRRGSHENRLAYDCPGITPKSYLFIKAPIWL